MKKVLLTRRHKVMCRAYAINFSYREAAKAARYKSTDHIRKLLKLPNFKMYVDHIVQRRTKRLEVTAERILQEYAKLAFIDISAFYDSKGRLLPFDKIPPEDRAAIAGLTYDSNLMPVLKVHDKTKALDSLGKYLGLFEKDNKQKSIKINVENRSLNDFYNEQ